MDDIQTIQDTFELIDDWEERYGYIISLGKALPPLEDADMGAHTRVSGCASQVWIAYDVVECDGRRLVFRAGSDAILVNGLIGVLLALYNHKTPQEVLDIDAMGFFENLGLSGQLTAQRANGLTSMIARIQAIAKAES